MATQPPPANPNRDRTTVALATYEEVVQSELDALKVEMPMDVLLDEAALRREGRFAILEAVHRFEGWGMTESSWVRVRVHQRLHDVAEQIQALRALNLPVTLESVPPPSSRRSSLAPPYDSLPPSAR